MIYALLNQKGGVGKTTLSIHLADALARRGGRILLVDADEQQSALEWSSIRAGENRFSVIGKATKTLCKELGPIAEGYDHVVIDGPPRMAEVARSIIAAADMVILPLQPSQQDVFATSKTLDLIKEVQDLKPALKSVIVINRKIVNTAIGRSVRTTLEELGTPVLEADIANRVIFAEAFAEGKTVFDKEPSGIAASEIEAFVSELTREHEQKSRNDRPAAKRASRA